LGADLRGALLSAQGLFANLLLLIVGLLGNLLVLDCLYVSLLREGFLLERDEQFLLGAGDGLCVAFRNLGCGAGLLGGSLGLGGEKGVIAGGVGVALGDGCGDARRAGGRGQRAQRCRRMRGRGLRLAATVAMRGEAFGGLAAHRFASGSRREGSVCDVGSAGRGGGSAGLFGEGWIQRGCV
jgi:hypothetical protein